MGVGGNLKIALLLAAYIALFITYEHGFSQRVKAQESVDTDHSAPSSEKAESNLTDRPIKPTDRTESEREVKQANKSAPPENPVFKEQTEPPPQPTLAEKKSPLIDQRKKEAAARQAQRSQPPPQPVKEQRPPAPDVHYIWVPGFWYWYNFQYAWVPGRWIAPRPGYVFVRPRWTRRAGVWFFMPGGWAIAGTSSVVYPLDIGIYVTPWLRHPQYYRHHRHHRHYARPHHRRRIFRPNRGDRPRARITTRHATHPRSRARHR